MDSITKMPYGFMTGPKLIRCTLLSQDRRIYPLVADSFGTYNLRVIQGGAEVAFQLNQLLDYPGWKKAFLEYCRLTDTPRDVIVICC
jgi:hypothetical protein